MRIMSRQEKPLPAIVKTGCVRPTIQASVASSMSRVRSASDSPTLRPRERWCSGSRPVRIAMKTRLSIPSTISSAESVTSDSQICGSVIQAKVKNSMAGVGAAESIFSHA